MTLVIIAMQLIIKVKSEVDKELFNKLVLPIDFRIILYRLPSFLFCFFLRENLEWSNMY